MISYLQMNSIPDMLFVVYWVHHLNLGNLSQGLSRAMGQSKLPLAQAMNAWDLSLGICGSRNLLESCCLSTGYQL